MATRGGLGLPLRKRSWHATPTSWRGGGSASRAAAPARRMSLAVAPTCAILKLVTGVLNGGPPNMPRLLTLAVSPLSATIPTYLPTRALHSASWLRPTSSRRSRARSSRSGVRQIERCQTSMARAPAQEVTSHADLDLRCRSAHCRRSKSPRRCKRPVPSTPRPPQRRSRRVKGAQFGTLTTSWHRFSSAVRRRSRSIFLLPMCFSEPKKRVLRISQPKSDLP